MSSGGVASEPSISVERRGAIRGPALPWSWPEGARRLLAVIAITAALALAMSSRVRGRGRAPGTPGAPFRRPSTWCSTRTPRLPRRWRLFRTSGPRWLAVSRMPVPTGRSDRRMTCERGFVGSVRSPWPASAPIFALTARMHPTSGTLPVPIVRDQPRSSRAGSRRVRGSDGRERPRSNWSRKSRRPRTGRRISGGVCHLSAELGSPAETEKRAGPRSLGMR